MGTKIKLQHILTACVIFMLSAGCGGRGDEITTFILVRHAEKADDGTEDPPLTAQGEARAKRLAFLFKDASVDAVYSTHYKRTRFTAEPLSNIVDVDVLIYEEYKPEVILDMLEKHRGGTVFISGHSNNIPWTANLLLGDEVYEDYDENQYGTILVISVAEMGEGSVLRLSY